MKLSAELVNGRLAVRAIIGMWAQDGLTSSPRGDWALHTDSPPCGFEQELIAPAPFSFRDPLGHLKDCDFNCDFNFKAPTPSDPAQLLS